MLNDRCVKNHKLFEGVSPSFYDLATCVKHPKNAHGVNKIDFLRVHHSYLRKLLVAGQLPSNAAILLFVRALKEEILGLARPLAFHPRLHRKAALSSM